MSDVCRVSGGPGAQSAGVRMSDVCRVSGGPGA